MFQGDITSCSPGGQNPSKMEPTLTGNSFHKSWPGRIAPSVGRLTQEPMVPGSIPGPTMSFVSPTAHSRRAAINYWRKSMELLLVNHIFCFPYRSFKQDSYQLLAKVYAVTIGQPLRRSKPAQE